MSGVSVDYMKEKLHRWHPEWNVERLNPNQIRAIYRKEQQKIVQQIGTALYERDWKPRN